MSIKDGKYNFNHFTIKEVGVAFILLQFKIYLIQCSSQLYNIFYKFAVSINLVDSPDHRKKHKGEVSLIGGIAVIFGFAIASLISIRSLAEWRLLFDRGQRAGLGLYHDDIPSDAQIGLNTLCFRFFKQALRVLI